MMRKTNLAILPDFLVKGIELYITVQKIVENITLEWELRIPITLIYRLIDEPEICQRDLEGGGR